MSNNDILYVALLGKHGTYIGSQDFTLPTKRVVHEAKMLPSPFDDKLDDDDPIPPQYILELHPHPNKDEENKQMYYSIKFHCCGQWLFANDDGTVSLVDEQQYLAGCTFRAIVKNNRVVFQSTHGMYLSGQKNKDLTCDRTKAKGWEEFTLLLPNAESIAFRSSSKWLVNLELGSTVRDDEFISPYLAANKKSVYPWDVLTVKAPGAKGGISLRGYNHRFTCAERNGSVVVDRDHTRRWECFHVILRPNAQIALLSVAHGTYVAVNDDGRVEAVSKSISSPQCELKVVYVNRGPLLRFIKIDQEQDAEHLVKQMVDAKKKHNQSKFDWERQYLEILVEVYDFAANLPERKQKQNYILSRIDTIIDTLSVLHKTQTLNVAEYRAELLNTVETLRKRLTAMEFSPKDQELQSNNQKLIDAVEKLSSFLISH